MLFYKPEKYSSPSKEVNFPSIRGSMSSLGVDSRMSPMDPAAIPRKLYQILKEPPSLNDPPKFLRNAMANHVRTF
jgi:hypothetical protein